MTPQHVFAGRRKLHQEQDHTTADEGDQEPTPSEAPSAVKRLCPNPPSPCQAKLSEVAGLERPPANMDEDLFMKCDDYELEPWQRFDDGVEEDDMDIKEGIISDNLHAASPSSETSHSSASSSVSPPAAQCAQATIFNASCSAIGGTKTLLYTTTSPVTVSVGPNTITPIVASAPMPTGVSLVPTGTARQQKRILKKAPAELGTTLKSTVTPGTHPAVNQPIVLTMQQFPVQNVRPEQSTVNPVGYVLNVQQSQALQPITFLTINPRGGIALLHQPH